jgi:hypothetical protein
MALFELEEVDKGNYYEVKVIKSGDIFGKFALDVDGCYGFWPEPGEGCYSDYVLLELGTLLKKLNKPFYDSVDEYYNSNRGGFGELEHKGFKGIAEYDESEELWHAKAVGIDSVTYIRAEGESFEELIKDFEQAVEDYLQTIDEL